MKKNDGGPAFPQSTEKMQENGRFWAEGASLRDLFAGLSIMTAALDDPDAMRPGQEVDTVRLASKAYEIADAMLAERAKP